MRQGRGRNVEDVVLVQLDAIELQMAMQVRHVLGAQCRRVIGRHDHDASQTLVVVQHQRVLGKVVRQEHVQPLRLADRRVGGVAQRVDVVVHHEGRIGRELLPTRVGGCAGACACS